MDGHGQGDRAGIYKYMDMGHLIPDYGVRENDKVTVV
jgi:hypothetical protein